MKAFTYMNSLFCSNTCSILRLPWYAFLLSTPFVLGVGIFVLGVVKYFKLIFFLEWLLFYRENYCKDKELLFQEPDPWSVNVYTTVSWLVKSVWCNPKVYYFRHIKFDNSLCLWRAQQTECLSMFMNVLSIVVCDCILVLPCLLHVVRCFWSMVF